MDSFSAVDDDTRQELLDKIPLIFKSLSNVNNSSVTHRKLYTKVLQRIGLIFLKPKIAPWRYQRGTEDGLEKLMRRKPILASKSWKNC